jgi:hypothetical protein
MLRNRVMPAGFIRPCQPSHVATPHTGPDWFHEIKHDGIRLLVRRDGDCVRAFTRNGNDWTARYPAIVAAASALRARSLRRWGRGVKVGGVVRTHRDVREATIEAAHAAFRGGNSAEIEVTDLRDSSTVSWPGRPTD